MDQAVENQPAAPAQGEQKKRGLGHAALSIAQMRWKKIKASLLGISRAVALAKADQQNFEATSKQAISKAMRGSLNVKLAVENVKELSSINYLQQGNAAMYSEDALQARHGIRSHMVVVEAIRDWWRWVPKTDTSTGGHAQLYHGATERAELRQKEALTQPVYSAMVVLIQMVLLPRFGMEADEDYDPLEDWQADSKGEDSMDFPNFFDALFELADMWCETVDAEDYAKLLLDLLEDSKMLEQQHGVFSKLLEKFGYHASKDWMRAYSMRDRGSQEGEGGEDGEGVAEEDSLPAEGLQAEDSSSKQAMVVEEEDGLDGKGRRKGQLEGEEDEDEAARLARLRAGQGQGEGGAAKEVEDEEAAARRAARLREGQGYGDGQVGQGDGAGGAKQVDDEDEAAKAARRRKGGGSGGSDGSAGHGPGKHILEPYQRVHHDHSPNMDSPPRRERPPPAEPSAPLFPYQGIKGKGDNKRGQQWAPPDADRPDMSGYQVPDNMLRMNGGQRSVGMAMLGDMPGGIMDQEANLWYQQYMQDLVRRHYGDAAAAGMDFKQLQAAVQAHMQGGHAGMVNLGFNPQGQHNGHAHLQSLGGPNGGMGGNWKGMAVRGAGVGGRGSPTWEPYRPRGGTVQPPSESPQGLTSLMLMGKGAHGGPGPEGHQLLVPTFGRQGQEGGYWAPYVQPNGGRQGPYKPEPKRAVGLFDWDERAAAAEARRAAADAERARRAKEARERGQRPRWASSGLPRRPVQMVQPLVTKPASHPQQGQGNARDIQSEQGSDQQLQQLIESRFSYPPMSRQVSPYAQYAAGLGNHHNQHRAGPKEPFALPKMPFVGGGGMDQHVGGRQRHADPHGNGHFQLPAVESGVGLGLLQGRGSNNPPPRQRPHQRQNSLLDGGGEEDDWRATTPERGSAQERPSLPQVRKAKVQGSGARRSGSGAQDEGRAPPIKHTPFTSFIARARQSEQVGSARQGAAAGGYWQANR